MGRYAFFSTGLEYKFRFAIQPSEDMLQFNGISYDGPDADSLIHKWEKKTDELLIKKKLEDYHYDDIKIDLTKFENNLEGTYDLKDHLDNIKEINDDHEFKLGYLIYHQ